MYILYIYYTVIPELHKFASLHHPTPVQWCTTPPTWKKMTWNHGAPFGSITISRTPVLL